MLKSLSLLLRIDEVYVRFHFLWAVTGAFEMPDALFTELLLRCINRPPCAGSSIEEEVFARTDLSRFAQAAGILDVSEKSGICLGSLDLAYSSTVRQMPTLLDARVQQYPKSKLIGERNCNSVGVLAGKTEFSIFLEVLFKAMPTSLKLKSPLQMCIFILQRANPHRYRYA